MNLLQAAKATDVSGLKLIFPVLAKAIGSATPDTDFTNFIAKVTAFEKKYMFWDSCNTAFASLNEIDPNIILALKGGTDVEVNLTDIQINAIQSDMNFLLTEEVLHFARQGNTFMTTSGVYYDCYLKRLSNFQSTVYDPQFQF